MPAFLYDSVCVYSHIPMRPLDLRRGFIKSTPLGLLAKKLAGKSWKMGCPPSSVRWLELQPWCAQQKALCFHLSFAALSYQEPGPSLLCSRRVFKLLSRKPFCRKQLLNECININQSRNCNPHFFTSGWELWPLAHSQAAHGLYRLSHPSSLQSFHTECLSISWNGLCSGEGTHLKNGRWDFWHQQLARMLLSSGVQATWSRDWGAWWASSSEAEASAEIGHFPEEMEHDRVACRSWIWTWTSKIRARWDLRLILLWNWPQITDQCCL